VGRLAREREWRGGPGLQRKGGDGARESGWDQSEDQEEEEGRWVMCTGSMRYATGKTSQLSGLKRRGDTV
jgi:hypothetical protein